LKTPCLAKLARKMDSVSGKKWILANFQFDELGNDKKIE
jgi:hypothetical protein